MSEWPVAGENLAALNGDTKIAAQQSFGGSRTKADLDFGLDHSISFSSQGRQAAIFQARGVLCMRLLPGPDHLKCLTMFVT